MATLLQLGKKTKLQFHSVKDGGTRLVALGDGIVIGHFTEAELAETEAKRLLAIDKRARFRIQDEDGHVSLEIHDMKEYRRKEKEAHWRSALFTAPVLFLLAWGLLTLGGSVSPATARGLALIPACLFFASMLMFNMIEALVPSITVMILICLGAPAFHQVREKAQKARAAQAARTAAEQQGNRPH